MKSSDSKVLLPPPPPLTSIERDRRMAKLKLLAQLEDGDEALEQLWSLWFAERGPKTQVSWETSLRMSVSDLKANLPCVSCCVHIYF